MCSDSRTPSSSRSPSCDSTRDATQRMNNLSVSEPSSSRESSRARSPEISDSTACRSSDPSQRRPFINCSAERRSPSPKHQKNVDGDERKLNEISVTKILRELLVRKGEPQYRKCAVHFVAATRDPPITAKSLRELDMDNIVSNPKVRHDINFDRDLHFRPNIEGEKGKTKQEEQKNYWLAIQAELELYRLLALGLDRSARGTGLEIPQAVEVCQRRIPSMFQTIKDILIALVPEGDKIAVREYLDVDLVMQEIRNGQFDFESTAEWLAQLLKRHCAPMRDESVDRMVRTVKRGSPVDMAFGLRELFGILETMKLDVANHQIRHFKPFLINDTFAFEQKYHTSDMTRKKFTDMYHARQWFLRYRDATPKILDDSIPPNDHLNAFIRGLVHQLLPSGFHQVFPKTFDMDQTRLANLRYDFLDLLRQNVAYNIFAQLVEEIGELEDIPPAEEFRVRKRLQDLAVGEGGGRFSALDISHIAAEIVRQALQVSNIDAVQDGEMADNTEYQLTWRWHDRFHLARYAEQLEGDLIREVWRRSKKYLSTSAWDAYTDLVLPASSGGPTLGCPPPPTLTSRPAASSHPPTSTSASSPSASSSKNPASLPVCLPSRPPPSGLVNCLPPFMLPRLDNIVDRMAHIGVLHWRVWAPLVYTPSGCAVGVEEHAETAAGGEQKPAHASSPTDVFPESEPMKAPPPPLSIPSDNAGEDVEKADSAPSVPTH